MRQRTRVSIGLLVFALAACLGCGPKPDENSGGDGRRDQAKLLPLDEWVTDETGVHYSAGDRTDWRKVELETGGTLYVEVTIDNSNAAVSVALYDRYGQKLIEKTKVRGSAERLKFQGTVNRGRYFIQVYARESDDVSIYSLRASMSENPNVGDIPPPE